MREKTGNGDPLVSPGIVCYTKEKEKPWFSSLGQTVQFDTINFVELFKNYFDKFAWIGKSH